VQRGLKSRAYGAGRLSVRREAGENLFHKLLHKDLSSGLEGQLIEGAPSLFFRFLEKQGGDFDLRR
jgi:hypothetical protein